MQRVGRQCNERGIAKFASGCVLVVSFFAGGARAEEHGWSPQRIAAVCADAVRPVTPNDSNKLAVEAEAFGALGDGLADDSGALQAAVDSLRGGGTLVLRAGRSYRKTSLLVVRHRFTRIWGYGATVILEAERGAAETKGKAKLSIRVEADNSGVYGVTLVSNLTERLPGHPNNAAIVLAGNHQEAVDNSIEYSGNGIFVRMATDFLVARNRVRRTFSDGIHVTSGSSRGRVLCNEVFETGDDHIAVVNYGLGEPTVGDILIEGNDVGSQYWGRGIAVVGGRDIKILKNRVSHSFGAGILVNSESHWKTAHVRRVLVEGNLITEVQTSRPTYNPLGMKPHPNQGAIDLNGQSGQKVEEVVVRRNVIRSASHDGVLLRGHACRVTITGNRMSKIGGAAIRIRTDVDVNCRVDCAGNESDGQEIDMGMCEK